MGWNKYYVFVKDAGVKDLPQVLQLLQMSDYQSAQPATLLDTNKPETLFVGEYNDCLLLVHPALPFQVIDNKAWELTAAFPDVGAIVENATEGVYAYAVFKSGQRIRMKHGSEERIFMELGALLLEEQEDELFEEEELDEMREDGLSDREIDNMVRYETDVRVPGRLMKRYLGVAFNDLNLAEVKLIRYRRG